MSSSAGSSEILIGFLCFGLFILVFAGIGIYLILRSRKDKAKIAATAGWPSVMGRVLESRIIESSSTDSDGDSSTTYRPHVRYEYEVMGNVYANDKVHAGMVVSTSNYKKSQETAARYPIDSAVRVFFNPENPAEAVLEQKASTVPLLVIGIVFLAVGLCLALPIGLVLLLSINAG